MTQFPYTVLQYTDQESNATLYVCVSWKFTYVGFESPESAVERFEQYVKSQDDLCKLVNEYAMHLTTDQLLSDLEQEVLECVASGEIFDTGFPRRWLVLNI
jgi:hypothetical protein